MTVGAEEGAEAEARGLRSVVELMCVAARTAPKAKGEDNLVIGIVTGETKDRLTAHMRATAVTEGEQSFAVDAASVDAAPIAVLFGTKHRRMEVPACGLCGFGSCQGNEQAGAMCIFPVHDLGIAIGSAASVAADHRVDNRIMFTLGIAAVRLGLLGDEVKIAFGIPLSATGKNPFFDRK